MWFDVVTDCIGQTACAIVAFLFPVPADIMHTKQFFYNTMNADV